MTEVNLEHYHEREQSLIKHEILKKYLERFAHIVGSWTDGLIYVDAFSGPWNSVDPDLQDASFSIALNQLRAGRDTAADVFKKQLSLACIFLESNKAAFSQLSDFASRQSDVEVIPLNAEFEHSIQELVSIIKSKKKGWFPFIFIDPKGWKGFSMETIEPLIQLKPCEVLVNFMTGHIQRFIQDERDGLKASFRRLYGDDSYERRIEGLEGKEREEAMVFAYADRLATVGNYPFVSVTIVLHPTKDRTHFHLIYASRDLKGIEVFKQAERKALQLSETVRSDAKRRARELSTGQLELFSGTEMPETSYLDGLRDRYQQKAGAAMLELARSRPQVAYDDLYAVGLRFPTVQEAFVRQWIRERGEFIGIPAGKREPTTKKGIRVRLFS